ncbi:MAG: beta-galactosidase [Edaphobacter sp.]|uniref:glycoside hydrolase family 35 protein n=1 Tax=Edaphobacter sp. TaxID=1934404 RepID=UPI002395B704|nr:beta-galactosidase family protein [Edaphobacter sp.]MDE1177511.1 beta-galactosidase [Edaphobacter sp.]
MTSLLSAPYPSLVKTLRTYTLLALMPLMAATAFSQPPSAHRFAVEGDHFTLNGKPFQVISGELHYARIPRQYWRARLRMARAMGLNTIATYVFWNVHEPQPGVFDFTGNNDLASFIKMAQEEHLKVLLRAGPYSCAEWEFGGFPAWLLKDPKMATALRSRDPAFMTPAEHWIRRLAQELGPLQVDNGGPVIAVQVENEYGNFSNDHIYMKQMYDLFLRAGFNKALLYTVDPSKALANGMIEGVYSGVNFGTGRAKPAFEALEKLRPGQPLFATEYWPGWFDLWGHPHETRPVGPQLEDLNYILSHNGSVNIYMIHGGTSFGQMAGASQSTGAYRGNVTSYDYDAPIDEAGHPTAKFYAYRDVILKYTHEKPLPVPSTTPVIAIPEFRLAPTASLWKTLPAPVKSEEPLTMEQLDQSYGYVLYRKQLTDPVDAVLKLDHPYDFAVVYLDGKQVGTLDRHYHQDAIPLKTDGPSRLDILVENTGRLNSTKWMRDERKGFRAAVLGEKPLTGWEIYSLPMQTPPQAGAASADGPHFSSGSFTLKTVGDSYLDIRSLGKGLIWINGHPLGRFWNIGPQGTLYVPAPWLKKGRNDVAIFELLSTAPSPTLKGLNAAILDAPTPGYESDPERHKKKSDDGEFGTKLAAPADATKKPVP